MIVHKLKEKTIFVFIMNRLLLPAFEREGEQKKREVVLICWHCGKTGHEKASCLDYHLGQAMKRLLPCNANPKIRDLVEDEAKKILGAAIKCGKRGVYLRFGGSPRQLCMKWPVNSPPTSVSNTRSVASWNVLWR